MEQHGAGPGIVVTLPLHSEFETSHEGRKNAELAKIIAEVKGYRFAGHLTDQLLHKGLKLYFVPDKPLVGFDLAAKLGITSADDLFGGVVPYDYVRTKAIVHPLVSPQAVAPVGWNSGFPQTVANVVLPGFTAFTKEDARQAGWQLLDRFDVIRAKKPQAEGSRGQYVVHHRTELEEVLADIPDAGIADGGLILEANLEQETTLSVGTLDLAGLTISYYGFQRKTRDNGGQTVYGGTDLTLIRGTLDDLLQRALPESIRLAVSQAQQFHLARTIYAVITSRNNYDVIQGQDRRGNAFSGVLEQSWRIGGASGAEILAAREFKNQPGLSLVQASTFDAFGHDIQVPNRAVIHYRDVEQNVGPVVIYTVITRMERA